jgi:glycosyltransferase involved in cell wall biosynthesis
VTLGRVSDEEMHRTIADASLVVVASFDEGLSLPVIEALAGGTPVVASDIPAHRELIGAGSYLVDPKDLKAFAKAIRKHSGSASTQRSQLDRLHHHQHEDLEVVLARQVREHRKSANVELPRRATVVGGKRLSVGFATPWPPQRSGVADFSYTTCLELAKLCDLTIYTTADAHVPDGIAHAFVDDVLAHGSDHDVFVTVVGNSHFHVPFIELMGSVDAVAVAHDTRMVEFYMAMRGTGGVQQVMLRGQHHRSLHPPLDEQIDDMRLLQNAGFWEIANRSQMLVMHSPSAAPRIEQETGVAPRLLPFANQRFPEEATLTEQIRRDARARLGFDEGRFAGTVHIASFGYVDVRTKMVDTVVESAAWLSQWGHRVSLHLAGSASEAQVLELTKRAQDAGIENFQITGFLSDEQFRDYLLAVDIGLQLRVSPLLGVSGPLSDLAAYGTTSIASTGLCVDVDTPEYVDRLPDEVSPLIVAEAIEQRLRHPHDPDEKERQRVAYLDRKSPQRYAQGLYELLLEAADAI